MSQNSPRKFPPRPADRHHDREPFFPPHKPFPGHGDIRYGPGFRGRGPRGPFGGRELPPIDPRDLPFRVPPFGVRDEFFDPSFREPPPRFPGRPGFYTADSRPPMEFDPRAEMYRDADMDTMARGGFDRFEGGFMPYDRSMMERDGFFEPGRFEVPPRWAGRIEIPDEREIPYTAGRFRERAGPQFLEGRRTEPAASEERRNGRPASPVYVRNDRSGGDGSDSEEGAIDPTPRREREKDKERDRERDRDRDRERDRERVRDRDRERDRDRDRDKERDRDRREKERERDRERDRDKDRDKERGKSRERDRERERTVERDKERDRERDRGRDRERERDKEKDAEKESDREGTKTPSLLRSQSASDDRTGSSRSGSPLMKPGQTGTTRKGPRVSRFQPVETSAPSVDLSQIQQKIEAIQASVAAQAASAGALPSSPKSKSQYPGHTGRDAASGTPHQHEERSAAEKPSNESTGSHAQADKSRPLPTGTPSRFDSEKSASAAEARPPDQSGTSSKSASGSATNAASRTPSTPANRPPPRSSVSVGVDGSASSLPPTTATTTPTTTPSLLIMGPPPRGPPPMPPPFHPPPFPPPPQSPHAGYGMGYPYGYGAPPVPPGSSDQPAASDGSGKIGESDGMPRPFAGTPPPVWGDRRSETPDGAWERGGVGAGTPTPANSSPPNMSPGSPGPHTPPAYRGSAGSVGGKRGFQPPVRGGRFRGSQSRPLLSTPLPLSSGPGRGGPGQKHTPGPVQPPTPTFPFGGRNSLPGSAPNTPGMVGRRESIPLLGPEGRALREQQAQRMKVEAEIVADRALVAHVANWPTEIIEKRIKQTEEDMRKMREDEGRILVDLRQVTADHFQARLQAENAERKCRALREQIDTLDNRDVYPTNLKVVVWERERAIQRALEAAREEARLKAEAVAKKEPPQQTQTQPQAQAQAQAPVARVKEESGGATEVKVEPNQ